ncbi:MAG: insulinase family protein [Simkania sp.]|nr:insulinase family protein [Simkania sp.]
MNAYWILALIPILTISTTPIKAVDEAVSPYVLIENEAKVPLLNPSMQKQEIAKILLNNGVEAYIISDPDSKHSAVSVAVQVGSWDDPAEYPGMAHLVEHVLFMGTKAYPGENDFSQYITECSGKNNAFTASDRTVYMFAANHDGFEGAFDRLAHFFIDPLLCTSSLERELHAIDQEYAKNIEHDGWRQYFVLKQIGNPEHPNKGFSIGNANTLRGIPQEVLRSWFARYYAPDHMVVIVVSPLSKEKLIDLVVEKFSLVPKSLPSTPITKTRGQMFSKNQQGSIVAIKPIRDIKELSLVWELSPVSNRHDTENTLDLLAYLLNSPHEGGLIDTLKNAGWIQEGKAGFEKHSANNILFGLNFELTEEGIRNKDRIIQMSFETLEQVRQSDPQERFNEMRQLALLHYQYQTRQDAFDTVQQLSLRVFDERLGTFPEKSLIPGNFNSALFQELLSSLTPQQCCYMLTADPSLSNYPTDQKEQWLSAEFSLIPLEKKTLTSWQATISEYPLPSPTNPFVPQQLVLLPKNDLSLTEPSLLISNDHAKIYYQRDTIYDVPEIAMTFRIHTPLIDGSAKSAVLADLFCKSYQEHLHPTLYMASLAGLHASLSAGHHFVQLSLDGYSEKAPALANTLFTQLKTLSTTKENFLVYKEMLQSTYANASKELPCWQAKELLDNLLLSDTPTQAQKFTAIQSVSYEDFSTFNQQLFQRAFIEGFLYGNCLSEEAMTLSSQLILDLNASPLEDSAIVKRKVRLLPAEKGPFVIVESTDSLGKAALLAIQQGPFSYDARAKQLISNRFLHELFFDRLRTKQQTAYIAMAKEKDLEGQLVQLFLVQSNSHQPEELLARFDLFLDELDQEFNQLITPERFIKTRSMLLQELSLPPENLQAMAQRMASLTFEYQADFAFYPKIIESVQKISHDDIKSFVHNTLSRTNTRRLAVLVDGKLSADREFVYRKTGKEELIAIGELESRDYR